MNGSKPTNRRTVLKTLSAGVAGGAMIAGTAGAHGDDDWGTPAWLLTDVWEMADRRPSGQAPTGDNSHVPIYYIAPGANPAEGYGCAQIKDKEFRQWANLDDSGADFEEDAWKSADVDQTLHDRAGTENPPITEFTTLWHVHFVFGRDANEPYHPDDLVNEDPSGNALINSGNRIADTELQVVSAPFVFNCPARPAQGVHLDYCP